METTRSSLVDRPENGGRSRTAWLFTLLLLGLVLWTARYRHASAMGFYEDDYTLITRAMAATWPEVREFVSSLLLSFGGQGRPLQHSAIYLLSYAAARLGGLPAAYWLGWMVLTLNSVLAYALLRRLFSPGAALTGGLAYTLFGADTTQAWLTAGLGLQQSLTYLLLALHLYLSNRRFLSYILILGSLLSYETAFPVFLAAPLMANRERRLVSREMLSHAAIVGILFVGVSALRFAVGEARVAGLKFPDLVAVPILHMVQGPVVSLGTYLYRPFQVGQAFDGEMGVVVGVMMVVLLVAFWLTNGETPVRPRQFLLGVRARTWAVIGDANRQVLRLAGAGSLMLVLAYPLTFTVRAHAISGRDTRVHLAAVVGAAILWACLAEVLYGLAATKGRKTAVSAALAACFALMVGFGLVVQRSYVRAWEVQREFWTEVLQLCPDLDDGVVVLVEPSGMEDPRFIYANHWNLPRVMEQVLDFPDDCGVPPRVYRLLPGWPARLVAEDGKFRLDGSTVLAPRSLYGEVDSRNVIFLESAGGTLRRIDGPLVVEGES